MRRRIRNAVVSCLTIGLALVLVAPSLPRAQQAPGPSSRPFKPEQLEQLVTPIAQYPDPVVAQIFMASTYPLEVVQAARFAKANSSLKGDALDAQLKKYNWDGSVKALVNYPQILERMDNQLDWMQNLSDAFVWQQQDTLDAVRRVRAKTQQAAPEAYWYYCSSAQAYYPTVPSCPEPWVKVPPRAQ
jgi:hypothetical protein